MNPYRRPALFVQTRNKTRPKRPLSARFKAIGNAFRATTLSPLFFGFLFFSASLAAQETVVVGQVFDKTDGAPLPSVRVFFKGSTVQTESNEEGYFLIRNRGNESTLVFSLIGYKSEEVKINPGESAGLEMQLEEKVSVLGELFVYPGTNPADDLMKKVRENRRQNDRRLALQSREQSVVFLSKKESRRQNNRLFEQLRNGNLTPTDSSLLAPVYIEESVYNQADREKEIVSKNTFNTDPTAITLVSTLLQGLYSEVNFYKNSVSFLGKTMISPLASAGRSYYRYYLTDSLRTAIGKEYRLHFRTKNPKNLAFNGEMRIDSATYALTYIHAELPRQANLNFIHNLSVEQLFDYKENAWIPKKENTAWNMTYELLRGKHVQSPELLINRSAEFAPAADGQPIARTDSFAHSAYTQAQLETRLEAMQQAPLYKTAAYIADAVLTGHARVGVLDVGPFVNIARLTKVEGLRLAAPIRTNEHLWKNILLGGHLAYGFRDKELKYSAQFQWKLPVKNNRIIAGISYLNDYRRIDYDYNNFLLRESPLRTGDENLITTFLAFRFQNRISKRHEFTAFLSNDWTPDIESKWAYRDVTYFPNEVLPLARAGTAYPSLRERNFSLTTRFSFREKTVEEHFQRLYVDSPYPVAYATLEAGQYQFGSEQGNYGKISGSLLHQGKFLWGEWRYMVDVGKIFGSVPYPLLKFMRGRNSGPYNRFEFSLMNNREYIADTYGMVFTELITNGIVFNYIPLIKHLNLREIASFKTVYGTLANSHADKMDIPPTSSRFTRPYSEVSVGICNLLGFMSFQSIWRLSDWDKPGVKKWAGIRFSVLVMI